MARRSKLLYIGTRRYVAALDPKTGEETWRTKLPHATGAVVTLLVTGDRLFVGHGGHAYALDKRTGEILWENGLSRMGYGPVLLAMEGVPGSGSAELVASADQQRRQGSAAGGTT
jgi:outer membrane protein assembly factor BamB